MQNGYRLYNLIKDKVIVSRDVKFIESEFPFKLSENKIIQEDEIIQDESNDGIIHVENNNDISNSGRIRQVPRRYQDYELYVAHEACNFVENVPLTYEDVHSRNDKVQWTGAIERELCSINDNNTWEIVDKPQNVQILE
uniref:Retroviral polymerase SH3-like domain-containing protein n=1 Tax=Cacopsylla melanoneura TaxID=428564 RepID=A0A8D8TJQ7_9HEMI